MPIIIEDNTTDEPIVVPRGKTSTHDRTKPKKQPPFAVIVHNDDCHTFPYVIELLRRVCGHPLAKAIELTQCIHMAGRASVWSGALEVG